MANRRNFAGGELLRKLAAAIDRLDKNVDRSRLAAARRPGDRAWPDVGHARPAVPRDELSPWASTDAEAALLLAAVFERERDFAASNAQYETAARLLADAESSPNVTSGLVRAYTGMAFTARELGQPAAAEAIYQRALTEVPTAAPDFHFQLGKHYELAGRPRRPANNYDGPPRFLAGRLRPAGRAAASSICRPARQAACSTGESHPAPHPTASPGTSP